MKLRLANLVHAVLALAVAGSLGFGVSQAFASDGVALRTCPAKGYEYAYASCGIGCPNGRGYCDANGTCRCGDIP